MAPLTIPPNLADDIAAAGDDERRAWLAALQDMITALSDRWSLTVGEPYCPGGCCSWVAPVRVDGGGVATAWDGSGGVAPSSGQSDGLAPRGASGSDPGSPRRGDPGASAAELVLKVGWSHDESLHEPTGLRAWNGAGAVRLFAEHHLLCTDLHAENILAAQRQPWLAIDPKPYVGDPSYDALQHMLNCPDRLQADPRGLARRMAELCELDADRVTAWLLARSVVESIGDPTLAAVAGRLAAGARS